jgi:hypothetical protein
MHIKDSNGQDWVCLCRQWDGNEWVLIPEWMMYERYWYMINYFWDHFYSETMHRLNLDSNVGILSTVGRDYVFRPQDPIEA